MTVNAGSRSERFVPGGAAFPHQAELHISRYEWACQHLRSAERVLDVACGMGYGSAMLRTALNCAVVGVDVSDVALGYAAKTYGRNGLEFVKDDAQALTQSQANAFDVVVSFETVEHVPDPVAFLNAVSRVLRPGGRFLVSTPDRRLASVMYPIRRRPSNPHHLIEFTQKEFLAMVGERFAVDRIYGQSFVPASLVIWPIQFLAKGIAHKVLGSTGKNWVERTYWRGTGTQVQAAEENRGKVPNYIVLSCIAK